MGEMLSYVALIVSQIAVLLKQSNGMQMGDTNFALPIQVLDHGHCLTVNLIRDHPMDIRFMKQTYEKPSKSDMRFFTPELYLAFNSSDDDEADLANTMWEESIQKYQRHLDSFRNDMSYHLQSLSDLALHDAEIRTLYEAERLDRKQQAPDVSIWPYSCVLTLQKDNRAIILIYSLWEHIRLSTPIQDWRFSNSRLHWLYDEIEPANGQSNLFWHRILRSDGRVIELPVKDVLLLKAIPIR